MNRWNWLVVVVGAAVVLTASSCRPTASDVGRTGLRGDYLGQTPPASEPELFAPGLVTTGLYTRDVAVTPDGDEIYFSVATGSGSAIMVTRRVGGRWREARVAPFSGVWRDFEPFVAPSGDRLLFLSNRPPDGKDPKPGWGHQNIWQATRQGDGWTEPELMPKPITTDGHEFFPSVTADGTLYFTRGGGGLKARIFRSIFSDGSYLEPEELPAEVNSVESQFNGFISADEDLLLFAASGRDDSRGDSDCYVSFRAPDGSWSGPFNLGDRVNDDGPCDTASLSPDGRVLFFMSTRRAPSESGDLRGFTLSQLLARQAEPGNGSADIYWVDAGFIDGLRRPRSVLGSDAVSAP